MAAKYNPRDLERLAKSTGMQLVRVKGSHAFYSDPITGIGTTIVISGSSVGKAGTVEGNVLPAITLNARLRNVNIYKDCDGTTQEFIEGYHKKAKEDPLNWIPESNRVYTYNGETREITNPEEVAQYIRIQIAKIKESKQQEIAPKK